jgi:hypothetical protein
MKTKSTSALLLLLVITFSTTVYGQVIDGYSANVVVYPTGKFTYISPGLWRESNSNGQFDFKEIDRNRESIFLFDNSRNYSIQLDLQNNAIILNYDRPNRTKLYNIVQYSGN